MWHYHKLCKGRSSERLDGTTRRRALTRQTGVPFTAPNDSERFFIRRPPFHNTGHVNYYWNHDNVDYQTSIKHKVVMVRILLCMSNKVLKSLSTGMSVILSIIVALSWSMTHQQIPALSALFLWWWNCPLLVIFLAGLWVQLYCWAKRNVCVCACLCACVRVRLCGDMWRLETH